MVTTIPLVNTFYRNSSYSYDIIELLCLPLGVLTVGRRLPEKVTTESEPNSVRFDVGGWPIEERYQRAFKAGSTNGGSQRTILFASNAGNPSMFHLLLKRAEGFVLSGVGTRAAISPRFTVARTTGTSREKCSLVDTSMFGFRTIPTATPQNELRSTGWLWRSTWEGILHQMRRFITSMGRKPTIAGLTWSWS